MKSQKKSEKTQKLAYLFIVKPFIIVAICLLSLSPPFKTIYFLKLREPKRTKGRLLKKNTEISKMIEYLTGRSVGRWWRWCRGSIDWGE